MGKLGSLVLDVRANTAKFAQAMDSVDKRVAGVAKGFSKLLGAAVAVGGAAGLASLVKTNLAVADSFAKAADRASLGIEAYQEIAHHANLAGVDNEMLSASLSKFTKRIGEAKANTGPMVTFLKKYDETLLEALKTTNNQEQALYLVSEAIKRASSDTDRAAIANAAFGDITGKMTLALKGGAKAIDEGRQRAKELGVVLSEDVVRNSEKANDRIEELEKVLSLKLTKAVADNAETIETLASSLITLVDALGKGIGAMQRFASESGSMAYKITHDNDIIRESINNILVGALGVNGLEKNKTPVDLISERIEKLKTQIQEAQTKINKSGSDRFWWLGGASEKDLEKTKQDLQDLNEQMVNALIIRQNLIDFPDQPNVTTGVVPPSPSAKPSSTGGYEESAAYLAILDQAALKVALDERFKTIEQALSSELALSENKYQDERYLLEEALNANAITYEDYYKRLNMLSEASAIERARIEEIVQEQITASRENATGAAIEFLQTLGQRSKTAAKAAILLNKGLAIAQAVQNTAAAVTKTLAVYGGTPAGYAAAASVKAIGAIQVGLIAATGLAQLSQVGTSAGAPGTPANPYSTDSNSNGIQASGNSNRGTTNINIYANNMYGVEHLEQVIVDAVRRSVQNDNIIIDVNSRNGRELAGTT